MISGRLIKLVVFELLEFAAFSVPTLVIVEQFAAAYQNTRIASDKTHYWLIVSCSIAYVALATLVIWVPVKVLLHRKLHLYKKITGWRPVLMMCVILTTLPSFAFSIAVTEIQKNINGSSTLPDMLPDLPVSLVLLSLIIVDIIEKLRIYPLRGSQESTDDGSIHTTSLPQIKTVTEQVRPKEENSASPQAAGATQVWRPPGAMTQSQASALRAPPEPSFHSGILKIMSRRDVRAEIFLWSFLLWSDTVEMVRVAGHPNVYKSHWVYPVYIFSFISVLRMIFTPKNPLLNSVSVLLQDLPFVFVRFGLIIVLGTITPVWGLCKNILVILSYVYFNHLTRLRVFSAFELSPF
uniref:Transmembrane protein 236 n=1 Tax=Prolemur simus TaxID=1328070 RepID=A0A8C8YKC1_PROSS